MRVKTTKFITSFASAAVYTAALTEQSPPEVCMVGRSNVGKSTFINTLTGQKIAKTSSQPGRTRLINVFSVNDGEFNLIDLPGYGYAQAGKQEKDKWQLLADGYFKSSTALRHAFVLVDCRHDSMLDKMMLDYFYYYHIPFTVLASKCDKLSRAQLGKRIGEIAAFFKIGTGNIIPVSENGMGKESVLTVIEAAINLPPRELSTEQDSQQDFDLEEDSDTEQN